MSNLQVEANQSTNNIPITLTPKQQPTLLLTPDKVWGTKDYEDLENKPSLNGRELTKGMTLADFNLYPDKVEKNEKYISELEATVDILTNTDTKKGELVHITDALPLPTFENKVDGNVKQETTKGTNEFNAYAIKKTTIVVEDNGKTIKIPIDDAQGYTNTGSLLKDLCPNLKVGDEPYLYFTRNLGTKHNNFIYLDGTKEIWFNETKKVITQEMLDKTVSLYGNNLTSGGETEQCILTDFRIVKEQNAPWEKFTNGASPNPEYPQEIEVVEGYNEFNSFIATKLEGQTGELQIEKDGTFVVSGNAGSNNYFGLNETLGELCPSLKDGDTVYLNLETTSAVKSIYFGEAWANNQPKTITQKMLDTKVVIYGGYNQTDKIKVQVSKTPNKPYLPYGCVGYKNVGKNILSISKRASGESQGVIFTNNFDGTYTLKGTATANVAFSICNDQTIKLLKNNSYTLSTEIIKGTLNFPIPISVKDKDNNLTYNFMTLDKPTVKCDKDYYIHQVDLYIPANRIVDCTICVQIEPGDKPTDYEPYQKQIVPLDLKGNWVGAINDTIKDYLVTDKKKYWLVKNVGKVVLDGSENWVLHSNSGDSYRYWLKDNTFREKFPNIINGGEKDLLNKLFSNYFIQTLFSSTNIGKFSINNEAKVEWFLLNTNISTIDEFKNWLSNNNVEFYYPLAEPQIIELGELPEPIKTFEGVNNIQLLANLDTEIEVKYALDVKKYYDNKLAEISAQII